MNIEDTELYQEVEEKNQNYLLGNQWDRSHFWSQRRVSSTTLSVLSQRHGVQGFTDKESFIEESERIARKRVDEYKQSQM